MTDRPKIPRPIQQQLLFECRHRCAVACEPVALENAHIIPWSETKDNSATNLIVLCANCHTRADVEKWSTSTLRKYKQNPCALAANAMPVMSPEQKAMVDFILASHPDSMTDMERLRFASITAAYAGILYSDVKVVSVTPANSSRVRVELPQSGAEALIAGYQARDPRMFAFFSEFGGSSGVLRVEAAQPDEPEGRTDVSEKGLETLIFSGMTGFGWIAGDSKDYDQGYAVDLAQLTTFLRKTQEITADALQLETDSPERRKFLARLQAEITSHGVIHVLRHGVKHGKHDVTFFYGTPSPGNDKAVKLYRQNRFSTAVRGKAGNFRISS